jgi:hypothetical protein
MAVAAVDVSLADKSSDTTETTAVYVFPAASVKAASENLR